MTINTLAALGLYLKAPVFTHGQFYVAVSRITSRKSLQILIENADGTCGSETRNIVFSEIFQSLGRDRSYLLCSVPSYVHYILYFTAGFCVLGIF
jgi:hypothetical protein